MFLSYHLLSVVSRHPFERDKHGTNGTRMALIVPVLAVIGTVGRVADPAFSAVKLHAWHDLSHFVPSFEKLGSREPRSREAWGLRLET